jgi:hypothetical protein
MAADFDWAGVVDYAKREQVTPPLTQYELPGVTEEMHLDVPVAVVPLWHAVVTAKLAFPPTEQASLVDAQRRLDRALAEVERIYPLAPHGLFTQVGYGTSYFSERIPDKLTDEHMPKATNDEAGHVGDWALIDSIRFPKDPQDLVLEGNDICFHFKSDYREHIENVIDALFNPSEACLNGIPAENVYVGDLFTVTSMRRGFAGRGMPKRMGMRLGIPGAESVPDGAMLFMGFTSSHVHGLAQGNLSSFETIPGYTDATPDSYFAHGTAMHLSHIAMELDRWYSFTPKERLQRMFHGERAETAEVLSPDQSPGTVSFEKERDAHIEKHKLVGHNEQMQYLSRVREDTTTAYGEKLEKGTVFFLRQDFDTVENPFGFSLNGPISSRPRAGVHFIGFGPSAEHFEKMRLEMDGVEVQQRNKLADTDMGFTDMLVTTHRQNYLLPPRAHRSFPLAELL